MEPADVIDEVNELLRLGVGDAFRLEHIKQAYIHEKTVWDSDQKYLADLKEKYLDRIRPDDQEDVSKIHCWKCGKKNPVGANYCMMCGAALFEVGKEQPEAPEPPNTPPSEPVQTAAKTGRKKWIIIAVAAAALVAAAAALAVPGGIDLSLRSDSADLFVLPDSRCEAGLAFEQGVCRVSACGPGTVFDESSRSCVLPPCGPGLAYDPAADACVVPP